MMTAEPTKHFLQHFFTDMRARGEMPLLYEKQGTLYQIVTHRETASRIADFMRALSAAHIEQASRVTFYAAAGPTLLVSEWGVLASRGVVVIVPRSFSVEELMETLNESKSALVIVDRLATAHHLAGASSLLPDLKHIICFEGGGITAIPIWSWNDFIDSGRREPDRSNSLMRSITEKDTALLFYFKNATHKHSVIRYTHELLLQHVSRIESLLAKDSIRKEEVVLTATAWEHPVGHIASCYVPILKEAVVQITHGIADMALFENSPQVTVGDAVFFDGVRQSILKLVRQAGPIESFLFNKAISLSKINFETAKNINPVTRFLRVFLKATIIKKVQKMLGGRLRLFIGTDDEAHHETQLFFHTFGIELIELPQEMFR